MQNNHKYNIAILGLGYVGLPLALSFGKFFNTTGYDINTKRVFELKQKIDSNNESTFKEFIKSKHIHFTSQKSDLANSNIFIVTVPTPIYNSKKPDDRLLKNACKLIGNYLKKNDVVIFESTVYPGMTETICVPILSKISNLRFKIDFNVGYSPERINPGDKKRKLENIPKLVSASNTKTLTLIHNIYSKIIKATVHKVETIKITEAAKIIENTQRDINIAFINELSILFSKMNIDTYKVLKAANTKWNFLNFNPGLVGGHCIGVDPYYLTYIAEKYNYKPQVILSGRKLNDEMYKHLVKRLRNEIKVKKFKDDIKILIMGYTFKENCSDIRNSQVIKIKNELSKKYIVDIYDPYIYKKYNKKIQDLIKFPSKNFYDVIIIAVNHKEFIELGINKILSFAKNKNIIFDLKKTFKKYNKSISL